MKYFVIDEFLRTSTGLDNTPTKQALANINLLIENVLDPVREMLGEPIKINSGFRSKLVNTKVGGAKKSQHLLGQAADLNCIDNKKLFHLIKDNLTFDQLVWEKGDRNCPAWVHVSFAQFNRKQVLYRI